jgi:ribose 5-phosphate isomerase B
VDFPVFAAAVVREVVAGDAERGVLVCGSGVGASIAASKLTGVRCALCHDSFSARQGVEDDDMNVLALGARVIGPELAVELLHHFLDARFSGAERHRRRVEKIAALERARV